MCEDLDVTLVTHGGGGERPLGGSGRAWYMTFLAEVYWLSRRGLWQMIFGGVFERHPRLQLVFAELGVTWVPDTLRELDAIHASPNRISVDAPARRPSEYFAESCTVVGSFMAPYEAQRCRDIGVTNLMWGSDYPHVEGTWPRTELAMRNTFAAVGAEDTRVILGDNGIRAFHLDATALGAVADRIGPSPDRLAVPLADDEFPEFRSLAFRELGDYA